MLISRNSPAAACCVLCAANWSETTADIVTIIFLSAFFWGTLFLMFAFIAILVIAVMLDEHCNKRRCTKARRREINISRQASGNDKVSATAIPQAVANDEPKANQEDVV